MNRTALIIISILIGSTLWAQEKDTSATRQVRLDEVVVTATRTKRKVQDIPAQVQVITREDIEAFPVSNIDDLLRTTANVAVNRSWGIFSKNSAVTMHGLSGSQQTLILVDGVPKNRIAAGSVNWHNINPDNIDRIEIIKGPASALYGNNAMGGVINIITKRPEKPLEGSVQAFYGTYNTAGGSLNLSGNESKNNRGFYWDINGYYRRGDGYYLDPPEYLDPTDVKTYLKEYGAGTMLGYRFGKTSSIEVTYDYYDELRGAGLQVHLPDGSYESTLTHQVKAKYTGKIGRADLTALVYYSHEKFYGQKESLNELKEYRITDSFTDKNDQGFWITCSDELFKNNRLTVGTELKMGDVAGEDIYRTSTDLIQFASRMDVLGFFIQDEYSFLKNRFKVIAGLRDDMVRFYDGWQKITDPTNATGFVKGFSETFSPNRWNALSPKLSLQYTLGKNSSVYVSAANGFLPPDLKDLSQTGKIRKGFRLANPNLKPEILTNYEIGYSRTIAGRVSLNAAVYYSHGHDFQYMIGTGDSVDTGSGTLKPVLQPENIAKIGVRGFEISAIGLINKYLTLNVSYSYNDSRIIDFGNSVVNPDLNLTGKFLVEVSPHLFYAGLTTRNRYFTANLNCNYVAPQWFDDENTILVDDYFVANLKISRTFKEHYNLHLDIQNLLNKPYIDRKGQLSPGRFITLGFKYLI